MVYLIRLKAFPKKKSKKISDDRLHRSQKHKVSMICKEKKAQNIRMVRRLSILKQPIFSTLNNHLIDYLTPSNLSYWRSFGLLAGLCLVIQIITGVFLAMHYTPHVDLAFLSVERIMRDVKGGWLLRYMHANGASMFFIVVYLHIFCGLYYGSYASPRELVWCVGVVILLLMIVTTFRGYVLPWGQFGPSFY